jgi:hypothetical protein
MQAFFYMLRHSAGLFQRLNELYGLNEGLLLSGSASM